MDITSQLFVSDRAATQAEVERAESMLKRDGLIPVEDRSGHRAALGALAPALPAATKQVQIAHKRPVERRIRTTLAFS